MRSILKELTITAAANSEQEILEYIDDEFQAAFSEGDLLGAGEWLASSLNYQSETSTDELIALVVALWSSVGELPIIPKSMKDLVSSMSMFEPANLARSLIAVQSRHLRRVTEQLELLHDLSFRLLPEYKAVFAVGGNRPQEIVTQALTRFEALFSRSLQAQQLFRTTNCSSARTASIGLLKAYRSLKLLSLSGEQPLLSSVETLLGGGFREFTLGYERGDFTTVIGRLGDVRNHATAILRNESAKHSVTWQLLVKPVADHLLTLVEEANKVCQGAITPELRLSSKLFKADLARENEMTNVTARLLNKGVGVAMKIRLETSDAALCLHSPSDADIPPGSDLLITFQYVPTLESRVRTFQIEWQCLDVLGAAYKFEEQISFEQQKTQPDWETLLDNPPYSTTPIKHRRALFGREAQLNDLLLSAASSTSTFLWGQKRVGKTSLLQVLKDELLKKRGWQCIYLRMGELIGMHEGQLAYTIASRLTRGLPAQTISAPTESDFGAGAGRLIPFVEELSSALPTWRFVVIIDEFDDLNPAFYTGERGRVFVKALRSLSEIGLTFFFAGSERMSTIYTRHSQELNKWKNMFLDSLEFVQDCQDLIVKPVHEWLEYEPSCVSDLTWYCNKNPFFLQVVCSELFRRCTAERRTFIGEADAQENHIHLARTLGLTYFAHFWEDNPTLEREENRRFSAENCLTLCCMSSIAEETRAEDVFNQQEALGLGVNDRLSQRELTVVLDRLRMRKVLSASPGSGRLRLTHPIFEDWLGENSETRLLPIWRAYSTDRMQPIHTPVQAQRIDTEAREVNFPIAEDDLLALSSQLVYCGKQKDVAELRTWLKQFDDDTRIEIAYLLLKRLTEKGFTSAGTHDYLISRLVEAIGAYRVSIGQGGWIYVRGKRDNLCISYLDSDLKSGANLARDVAKRLAPGKAGDSDSIRPWLKSRAMFDPMIVLVDDFSGTGATVSKGLAKWKEAQKDTALVERLFDEGRILLVLLHAFSSAVDHIREAEPRLHVITINACGNELLAFDPEAGIFESPEEAEFAKEIVLQFGRELVNSSPLGFGDQGALLAFHDTIPNNSLPIFWSNGIANDKPWKPLFPRA